jgi:glycosyltransferase involved in cell wall biosynthesis
MHDQPTLSSERYLGKFAQLLCEAEVTIICVSRYHAANIKAILEPFDHGKQINIVTIYNPVDDELVPDDSPVDPSSVIFFSSPNRGLAFTLDVFQALRRRMPDLKLRVANPGYFKRRPVAVEGVEWLGSLPHSRVMELVRRSLCTLSANLVIPEPFGLVYAESNAVGTPVLAHNIGAAKEVLVDGEQVMPVTRLKRVYARLTAGWRGHDLVRYVADRLGLFDAYAERLYRWRGGERPQVVPHQRFKLSTVAEQWRTLLSA